MSLQYIILPFSFGFIAGTFFYHCEDHELLPIEDNLTAERYEVERCPEHTKHVLDEICKHCRTQFCKRCDSKTKCPQRGKLCCYCYSYIAQPVAEILINQRSIWCNCWIPDICFFHSIYLQLHSNLMIKVVVIMF